MKELTITKEIAMQIDAQAEQAALNMLVEELAKIKLSAFKVAFAKAMASEEEAVAEVAE